MTMPGSGGWFPLNKNKLHIYKMYIGKNYVHIVGHTQSKCFIWLRPFSLLAFSLFTFHCWFFIVGIFIVAVSLSNFHCWNFHCENFIVANFIVKFSLSNFHCWIFIVEFSLLNFHCWIFLKKFSLWNFCIPLLRIVNTIAGMTKFAISLAQPRPSGRRPRGLT